ncbi:hypothetical protein F5984_00545 [Rudanella paleaurantiibacter]|uniref:Right-handed parallel beta-helix repeat-containing protein n=1 Tax=Rudanella paleaurantiibacter TaxID=2614655 RepID=A0A7J5U3R1_9BACT|nr:choice-of-anchor Q domain-containing protein [Rudanella paleaurantiibacter]KAB7732484.1 hypothetical protein F5984_00545 [Rudanella paleaurantiibacter]
MFYRLPQILRLIILLFSVIISFSAQSQTTRFVSTTGLNTNPASATSWATSTTNLQGCLNASQAGDQVWIANGLYKPGGASNTNRGLSFFIPSGVKVYGSFVGNEASLDQRPALQMPATTSAISTTLSGEIGLPGSVTDNSYRVVESYGNASTQLDGFVITGGYAYTQNTNGGGIYLLFSSIHVKNCSIEYNAASGGGAAVACYEGSPTFTDCSFRYNVTDGQGGAMLLGAGSAPKMVNCILGDNRALQGAGSYLQSGATLQATNVLFKNNVSQSPGGGIYLNGSSASLTNCTLESNSATLGGGVFSTNGTSFSLVTSTIKNNVANSGGGVYVLSNASVATTRPTLITSCTLTGNTATNYGGGVQLDAAVGTITTTHFESNSAVYGASVSVLSSTATVSGGTFQKNKSAYGGGLYTFRANSILDNCTFTENTVTQRGGALCNNGESTIKFNRCRLNDNTSTDAGGAIYNVGPNSFITLTNSIAQRNSAFNGGVARTNSGTLKAINCTFEGNRSPFGGAFYDDFATLQLDNCILWNNGARSINTHDRVCEANHSLFEEFPTSLTGTNNFTATSSPFISAISLQLAPCSPAINAGNPAIQEPQVGIFDFAGAPRFYGNGRIDIGALELQTDASALFTLRNGDWTDPSVWSCGRVPTFADSVEIQHSVTIPPNVSVAAFRVQYKMGGLNVFGTGGRLKLGL